MDEDKEEKRVRLCLDGRVKKLKSGKLWNDGKVGG